MKFLVQVICVFEHRECREQVFEMEREHLTMETLGLRLGESKALFRGVQEFVVAEQIAADLERRRRCPDCSKRRMSKAQGCIKVLEQLNIPR
jgi:DNA-directed RNA polymerase subunit RPC12/RpoP